MENKEPAPGGRIVRVTLEEPKRRVPARDWWFVVGADCDLKAVELLSGRGLPGAHVEIVSSLSLAAASRWNLRAGEVRPSEQPGDWKEYRRR